MGNHRKSSKEAGANRGLRSRQRRKSKEMIGLAAEAFGSGEDKRKTTHCKIKREGVRGVDEQSGNTGPNPLGKGKRWNQTNKRGWCQEHG